MIRKVILLLSVFACVVNVGKAQFCGTVSQQDKLLKQHPEMAEVVSKYNDQLEKEITARVNKMDLSKLERTTADTNNTLIIPIVVHVVHDYGSENVTESQVNTMLNNLNDFYQLRNDTTGVINTYKKYVGKMNFIFRLATKDPQGNPTRGITRRYNYLTYGGDNNAKFDEWNPRSYMNIWVEAYIGQGAEGGGIVAAYAQYPSFGAAFPYYDGLMVNAQFIGRTGNDDGATVPHEVGHYFNLLHPFGNTNNAGPGLPCGDDFVDDTPPTHGDLFNCPVYTDTDCASGYFKVYPSTVPGVDSLVDYPDTVNVQNIMNYASCKNMFTKGQVARARTAAFSDVAGRDSLWTDFNLAQTGANTSILPGVAPVADFAIYNSSTIPVTKTISVNHFLCTTKPFRFKDYSWNDSIESVSWTFTDASGASVTSANSTVNQSFNNPGWVKVALTVVGKNGTNTVTRDSSVYVADPTGISAIGYFEEFAPGTAGDLNKWPIFNYYNNNFKWEYVNSNGYYDHNSIRYKAYDNRFFPDNNVGAPNIQSLTGDFDDLFSPAFDLSATSGSNFVKSLNFMYAGTTRTGDPTYMTDTLEISYSTDCGSTWQNLSRIGGKDLVNDGELGTEFIPNGLTDWSLKSLAIPSGAHASTTFFRFRYHPGYSDSRGVGSSNDFYMDRFNLSQWTTGINTLVTEGRNIAVAPNPTNSNTFVIIKDGNTGNALVEVSDITGKLIYSTNQAINGMTRVEIPATVLTAKGMYLVKVSTNSQVQTEKLVVY